MIETAVHFGVSGDARPCWREVRKATAAIAESECARRKIRANHQRVLSGADDLVWREIVADSHSQLHRPLPYRAQSPGLGQPTDQPTSSLSRQHRRDPTAAAPGRHAELLLSHRRLSV